MFLTAKLNLLSGVAIGAGAVLLMKQCCKQKKKHQKTTTHHSSKVANPKDGEASAQVVLVGSNNGVTSFVFRQEHLWLKPINFCYLRSLLGCFLIMISSYSGCYLSISSSQRQQMTPSCDQGSIKRTWAESGAHGLCLMPNLGEAKYKNTCYHAILLDYISG